LRHPPFVIDVLGNGCPTSLSFTILHLPPCVVGFAQDAAMREGGRAAYLGGATEPSWRAL